jgi:CBS domain-containing protein
MITVKRLLASKSKQGVLSVSPTSMVIDALHILAENNIGAVVVLENNRLVGIFSERDYVKKGIIKGRKAKDTPIAEVMTPNVFTVKPDMTIHDCMKLFSEKRIRHLPVLDGEEVAGVLSVSDIVNATLREQQEHIRYLESYISNA